MSNAPTNIGHLESPVRHLSLEEARALFPEPVGAEEVSMPLPPSHHRREYAQRNYRPHALYIGIRAGIGMMLQ